TFDDSGNLWISAIGPYTTNESPYGSLIKFDGTTWDSIDLSNSGLNSTYIHSITSSPLGMIWIGTNAGAACYNNGSWTTFTTWNSEILDNWVYDVCPLETEIWFGTYYGLSKFNGYGWNNITYEDSILPHPTVYNIEKSDNKLWVETKEGLAAYDGNEWEVFTSSNSILPEKYYYSLHVFNDDVWVGTGKGLFRYHDGNWSKYYTGNSNILGNIITGIASDSYNNIWITCIDQGISVYNDSIVISENKEISIPLNCKLQQNYPNPFNGATRIQYALTERSDVNFVIYDITGRKIKEWRIGYQSAGWHELVWNGTNNAGQSVSTGIYIYSLQVDDFIDTKKMVFMK
ncbi:T9SS type A sorting domain-containing protein, partial [bacterium]|nr:T9SS type A sorting domain-containing protein [bacterium]